MIYYDGDSYSYMGVETNTGNFLSHHYNSELLHYGYSGKNPEKIIRTAQRHSLINNNTMYFIGIGVPDRLEIFIDDVDYNYPNMYMIEEHSAKTLPIENVGKEVIDCFSHDFVRYKLLSKIIMLHDFLIFHNKDFVIHNLGMNYDKDLEFDFGNQWIIEVDKRPRILNFFENSLHDLMDKNDMPGWDYDQYGYYAHPTEEGHKMYAEYLIDQYERLK